MAIHYLKIALRNLLKHKMSSTVNIAGLAIGIVCCFGVWQYIRYERSYDTFNTRIDRIYRVVAPLNAKMPPALGPYLKKNFPEIADFVRLKPPNGAWIMQHGDKRFYENLVYWSDGSLFNILSFHLIHGNPATALINPLSVVITESVARKYFGFENPMGRVIRADNLIDLTVTGVMEDVPANSHLPADFFVSVTTAAQVFGDPFNSWKEQVCYTYLLLSPQASPEDLNRKIATVLTERSGISTAGGIPQALQIQSLGDIHLYSHLQNEPGNNNQVVYLYLLVALAGLLLIMACLNFVNLTTAHAAVRFKEISVRRAVGATRLQLSGQFLVETFTTVCLAMLMAIFIALGSFPSVRSWMGSGFGLNSLDSWGVWGILIGLTLLTGLISGGLIAFMMSSFPSIILVPVRYKGQDRTAYRKLFVLFQAVLMILLLIGTQVLYRQLTFIQQSPLGLNTDQTLILRSSFGNVGNRSVSFKQELLQNPRIKNMALLDAVPGQMGGGGILNTAPIQRSGQTQTMIPDAQVLLVGFGLVETLDLELLAGRAFSSESPDDDWQTLILNETAVRALGWTASDSAVGQVIAFGENAHRKIIGVVKDFHMHSMHEKIAPMTLAIRDSQSHRAFSNICIRIQAADPLGTIDIIKAAWYRHFPEYPFSYTFVNEGFQLLFRREARIRQVFQLLTVIAIMMACFGLLGLSSFMMTRRIKEIGIRKVLGARMYQIWWLLSKEIVLLTVCANVVAWPLAYFAVQAWLQTYAYRVDVGIATYVIGGSAALMVALLSVSYHVVKASMENPVQALRYE